MKYIKTYFIISLFLYSINAVAQENSDREYTPQEQQVVDEFLTSVDQARERVDLLQDRSPLYGKKYLDEEEMVRQAEQLEQLLKEGNYVDPMKLQEWNVKLDDVADAYMPSKSYEESITRHGEVTKRGDDIVMKGREKMTKAREQAGKDRKAGKMTESEYMEQMQRIERAEQRLEQLEKRIASERKKIDSLRDSMEQSEPN